MDSVDINELIQSKEFKRLRKKTVKFVLEKRAHDDRAFLQRMATVLRKPLPGHEKKLKNSLDGRQGRV